jgi:hypothetical protein
MEGGRKSRDRGAGGRKEKRQREDEEEEHNDTQGTADDNADQLGSHARRERKRRQVQERIGIDMDDEDDGNENGAQGAALADLGEEETNSHSRHIASENVDHGYKLEPFNVKRELKEKVFEGLTDTGRTSGARNPRKKRKRDSQGSEDEDGSAGDASSEDSADDDDPWFQSVRERGESAYIMSNAPAGSDDSNGVDGGGSSGPAAPLNRVEALTKLAALLLDDETPLQAIKRLKTEQGSGGSRKRQKVSDQQQQQQPSSSPSSNIFDQVIEWADVLISSGSDVNVYSETKEQLESRAAKLGKPRSDSSGVDRTLWEYVWDASNTSGQVYGPFTTAQMRQWFAAGHFSSLPSSAFRQVGNPSWSPFITPNNPFVQ